MRLIIAGTRTASFAQTQAGFNAGVSMLGIVPTTIVSGGASGADAHGETIAERIGVPVDRYPADWKKHGRSAGPIRNAEMAENADALIAIWDGKSRGTMSMIREARKRKLLVYVHEYREDQE